MKRSIYFTIFISFITVNSYSQISKNSLILMISEKDSIYISDETSVKIRYSYNNNNNGWWLLLNHIYIEDNNENNYKILLPKVTVDQYTENGNIITTDEFEKEIDTLSLNQASKLLRLRYPPYYYEYLDDNVYKTQRRYNIFILKESDLNEKYVPLYEVNLVMGTNEEH
ncbi:hypothetical protein EGM88_15155 [Aureibaculum marinum]|uniref:Uncharacterized protein n=2 Tax=Aureibaculum marinum TaxID=2487930 RepID=A0A3N4N4X3_9FLAO|nr:hypothetical protein EGM88_15155 [Aureibaculum marinum]